MVMESASGAAQEVYQKAPQLAKHGAEFNEIHKVMLVFR